MKFMVALDTGSDLFWVPCDCSRCASTNSTSYSSVCAFSSFCLIYWLIIWFCNSIDYGNRLWKSNWLGRHPLFFSFFDCCRYASTSLKMGNAINIAILSSAKAITANGYIMLSRCILVLVHQNQPLSLFPSLIVVDGLATCESFKIEILWARKTPHMLRIYVRHWHEHS